MLGAALAAAALWPSAPGQVSPDQAQQVCQTALGPAAPLWQQIQDKTPEQVEQLRQAALVSAIQANGANLADIVMYNVVCSFYLRGATDLALSLAEHKATFASK